MLADAEAKIVNQVDSRKEKIERAEALEIARAASKVWAAKGKKLTFFDMKKDSPNDDELAKAILGPTGNLRAPAIRRGTKLFVGFNKEEMLEKLL